ncbi:MAG: ABC transporter permease [Desulfobacula sp.]|nr:ABC transporter permease [Desulfobacula sp.]
MLVFILRRFVLLFLTMVLVSIAVFVIAESSPGNIAKNVLGAFITPEQEASFIIQNGLDKPMHKRYLYWVIGNDRIALKKIGMPLKKITTRKGFEEWWAVKKDGSLLRWKVEKNDLIAINRLPDGTRKDYKDNDRWQTIGNGKKEFWGVDTQNHAVRWVKGDTEKVWAFVTGKGWMESSGGPKEYIPLKKGIIRGDPGISFRTGRPVSKSLFIRLRNSIVLAASAFVIVMPLALLLGMIAGLEEGSVKDRVLSIGGMMFSVVPEFATGIFLTLIFSVWLDWLPGAAVLGASAPWEKPVMLVLPVLTLTLIELGYVLRITRSSMVEVMKSPYIRTAFLKGLPYRQVIMKHAVRNALIAPITVIMLHVNWLLGGIVIVEVVFGYPGLGAYLLDSALYKDFNALEAGAMIMVTAAVGTQLIADIIYTFLNPRIRYA